VAEYVLPVVISAAAMPTAMKAANTINNDKVRLIFDTAYAYTHGFTAIPDANQRNHSVPSSTTYFLRKRKNITLFTSAVQCE